ncbi:MAG: S8 family serine peptidase [Rhodospirillales bacterium]|nr:S8 family serine peptidase [Rhodospirillales bacterium]
MFANMIFVASNRTAAVLASMLAIWVLFPGVLAAQQTPPLPACEPGAAALATPCLAILGFDAGMSPGDREDAALGAGAIVRHNFSITSATAVLVPNQRAYDALTADSRIARIIPDRPVFAFKPERCSPWPSCRDSGGTAPVTADVVPAGVARIGADTASHTGIGIGVAIVDTGIDYAHADLNPAADYFDAFGGDGSDDNGHGTHVAGIVAALKNSAGIVGVAPEATLYAVKVLDSNGSGYDSGIIAGLDWVNGRTDIQVINMSLGRSGTCGDAGWTTGDTTNAPDNPFLRVAIQKLAANGISVIVAAGNDPNKEVKNMVPASCPEAIAVASTTAEQGKSKCKRIAQGLVKADTASFFTTDGTFTGGIGVTISAPGATREDNTCTMLQTVGIESLALGGGTTTMSGTSMAAPHVAGVTALLYDQDSGISPECVRTKIMASANRRGVAPLDSLSGAYTFDGSREGVLDAQGAIDAACP